MLQYVFDDKQITSIQKINIVLIFLYNLKIIRKLINTRLHNSIKHNYELL